MPPETLVFLHLGDYTLLQPFMSFCAAEVLILMSVIPALLLCLS